MPELNTISFKPSGTDETLAAAAKANVGVRVASTNLSPRLRLIMRLERTLVAVRYIAYIGLVVLYALGSNAAFLPDLIAITVGIFLQNAWAHFLFYLRRYDLFLSITNFFIHLASITLIVVLTGGEQSPFAVLYFMLIIGYAISAQQLNHLYFVTLLCALAYAGVLLGRWYQGQMNINYPVALNFLGMIMCTWLMYNLGRIVRRIELDAQERSKALASSEATLRAILNGTASPIIVCEENELISDCNDGACEFLGLRRGELIGHRFISILFDDGTLPNKLATLRNRGEYHGENIVLCANGDERNVDLMIRSFLRSKQRYFVVMMHDVTERKHLQEASRITQARLKKVNSELQQVDELRREFFSTVSQRLRSPLSGILGHMDLLLDEELGSIQPEQRTAVQSCRRSVMRVFGMLDEVMDATDASTKMNGKG